MSEEIPNLWPVSALSVTARSPFTILKFQAEQLSRITGGLLRGELKTISAKKSNDEEIRVTTLEVVSPVAGNVRRELLSISHLLDGAYPVSVWSAASKTERFSNENDFVRGLGDLLQSDEIISSIQSLIALANEQKDQSQE